MSTFAIRRPRSRNQLAACCHAGLRYLARAARRSRNQPWWCSLAPAAYATNPQPVQLVVCTRCAPSPSAPGVLRLWRTRSLRNQPAAYVTNPQLTQPISCLLPRRLTIPGAGWARGTQLNAGLRNRTRHPLPAQRADCTRCAPSPSAPGVLRLWRIRKPVLHP